MKIGLAWATALLTACGGGSSPRPDQSQARAERARSQTIEAGGVAGGETSEFSGGDIGACPEIVSSEPLDLDDPEVASWVAMAQGHHEQTLGWRRLVLSDEVVGFAEHTSVSIDVNVLGGRGLVYGSGGNSTDYELSGCDGRGARQIELEITLATADGAVAATFRSWFEPRASDMPGGVVLHHHGLNPDNSNGVDLHGALELRPEPPLGGTPVIGFEIEFSADSVQGTLSAGLAPSLGNLSGWSPIEAHFPDDPCGSEGRSIGLDEFFEDLGATPRALYQRLATARSREPIPAIWKSSAYGLELSPSDVPGPTEVSVDAGEPTRACAIETSVTVYAPVTVTTADGRVNLTQPFAFKLYANSTYINERTPWVPAADFDAHIGLAGVNLESGYGSVYFQNHVDGRDGGLEGSLEVSQWDAFVDRVAPYPVLEWCRGPQCLPETQ